MGPRGDDPLPWGDLSETDAVYFTAGDRAAALEARRARTLVSTVRGLKTLAEAGVELDALVASARDPGERYSPGDLDPSPLHVVRTAGAGGGEFESLDRREADAGRRRRCPVRSATPTAAATASPRDSPTGSEAACQSTRPCWSRPVAARPASPAAGPTRRSCAPRPRQRARRRAQAAVPGLPRRAARPTGCRPRSRPCERPGSQARSARRNGSRTPPGGRDRWPPSRSGSRLSSMRTEPSICPARCSSGSRTSTSCAPSRASAATWSGSSSPRASVASLATPAKLAPPGLKLPARWPDTGTACPRPHAHACDFPRACGPVPCEPDR